MLAQLNIFWGLSAILVGAATIATIYVSDIPLTVGYGIGMDTIMRSAYRLWLIMKTGWAAPPVWAMLWAAITTLWVQRSLRKEKAEWHKGELV